MQELLNNWIPNVMSRLPDFYKAIGDTLLTTKADAASHGYGVKSMKQAAEQAHGMLTWRYEQRIFTLSVLLQDISEN